VIGASEITLKDLEACGATEKVEPIMEKLAKASEPVVKRIAIAGLRKTLELRLTRNGITWDEAVPALEAISLELLKECAQTESIEPIVEELAEAAGAIALKITLAETRQMLQPRLAESKMKGAAWKDVVLVIAASGITIADVQKCVQEQDVELLVQKLAQSDTRTETVAGAKMGTDDCDLNGAPASDASDLTSAGNANLDVRGAITVAGANMGTDGIDSLPSTDARDSVLECLVALRHANPRSNPSVTLLASQNQSSRRPSQRSRLRIALSTACPRCLKRKHGRMSARMPERWTNLWGA
jgi:hypothetical protein